MDNYDQRIEEFKARIAVEPEWCEELFRYATIRLLAAKYAYYVLNDPYQSDIAYDLDEKGWYVMGRALGHLKEDDTSPCVDWNENHPLAAEAIALAKELV
jgi:hypothetical protein